MSAEHAPGKIENTVYIGRNIAVGIAVISTFFGNMGAAAVAAIDGLLLHGLGKLVNKLT